MVDISEAAVAKGVATVSGSLDRLVKKEKISEADKAAALARIKGSTSYDDLKGAQLVIEAATENHELKVKILKQLDGLLAPNVIIASNTSSISITQLAAATQRADRFIGMHFFILVPMINEAFFVLGEGLAEPEAIDAGMKLGCNQPIGPLALADMIGLDVCLAVMEVYLKEFGDSKYRPSPLLKEMVAAGRLGRKTGQGVYKY
jgi:3-hydroxybutyryl-CoA dehydrogenase